MQRVILLDNGSSQPNAVRQLRAIAKALARKTGRQIDPVSLRHSSKIPADRLDGRPADTLEPYFRRQLATGVRQFLIVPLFFGPSRAITKAVPELVRAIREEHPDMEVKVAEVLCPLPAGEPRLVEILAENLESGRPATVPPERLTILVDHGSPIPQVSDVRHWLAARLQGRLTGAHVLEAAMERRAGSAYDFNGSLLEEILAQVAEENAPAEIALAMQFIGPGRHAGPGGDVERICNAITNRHPSLRIEITPLVGEHPLLVDILDSRINDATAGSLLGAVQ